ncbi:MAG TPA: DUF4163 domain-containing protein [Croceibacterium sp.]|jgi:hypothetical protein
MLFRRALPMLCVSLAACSGGGDSARAPAPSSSVSRARAAPAPTPTASASATATPAGANSVKEQNDLYSFSYAWPAAAGNIAPLATQLQGELEKSKQDLIADAQKGKAQSDSNGFPYNPHYYSETWKVVANLPRWLSLTGDFSTYTGGAHGNYGRETLVWDKKVGRGFPAIDMFTSPAALGTALGDKLCQALDRERAKKRKGAPKGQLLDDFTKCVGVDQATVMVGSSNGKTFNRIGVWFGPYVAGPYAEGAYELSFNVDPAILDAVKPAYRDAFSVRR